MGSENHSCLLVPGWSRGGQYDSEGNCEVAFQLSDWSIKHVSGICCCFFWGLCVCVGGGEGGGI